MPPSLALNLTKDVMRAVLTVTPGADPNEKLTLDDIVSAGARVGIAAQIFNPETLGSLVDAWNAKREVLKDVIVAESFKPPKPGRDGRLEWLMRVPWLQEAKPAAPALAGVAAATRSAGLADTTSSAVASGLPSEGAARDMREVKTIVAVEAGQALLRIVPPGKGEPGEDLMGRAVPAPDGMPVAFQPGVNIEELPGQPGVWRASKAGFLRLRDGRPEVQDCFMVEGDVDYATGNIKYQRSVEVRGDVQDGFEISVGGDLIVGGTVGDCRVVVGGHVAIRGGFQGKGQGLLLAKGAVSIGFGGNQKVRAYGSIEILKEAYGMLLCTRESLTVHGPLVGGRVIAGHEVACATVGNDLGTPTQIDLGYDFTALEGLQEVDTRLKEYTQAQARFQARLQALREAYRSANRMEAGMARELVAVRQALDKIAQALPILQGRRVDLTEVLRKGLMRPGLQLRVEKQAFAGLTLRVGAEQLRLNDTLAGPRRFVYDEGRIKVF
jgi:uncharacterized protein